MSSTKKNKSKTMTAAKAEAKAAVVRTPTTKATTNPKKPAPERNPKQVSALDAAAKILAKTGKPMRSQELIEAMAKHGLWKSPGGKTPHATLYAAMLREIVAKGRQARFTKVERGQFAFNGKAA